jgi:hypothetical protein
LIFLYLEIGNVVENGETIETIENGNGNENDNDIENMIIYDDPRDLWSWS